MKKRQKKKALKRKHLKEKEVKRVEGDIKRRNKKSGRQQEK